MPTELEELKGRQDALEGLVRDLEHRLTVSEYRVDSIANLGPAPAAASAEDADGRHPAERDSWQEGVEGMLRSIGLHQGFLDNHLKDARTEVQRLQTILEFWYETARLSVKEPLAEVKKSTQRIEDMLTELVNRRSE